jgi:rod shape-determining protein MreC
MLLALVFLYLPQGPQRQAAWVLRASVLRPFLAVQEALTASRLEARQVSEVQAQLDSLTSLLSTQNELALENQSLRNLLALSRRVGPGFRSALVIRPGTPGSESMFILDVGASDGVTEGAPVIDRHGLVGVVREVRPRTSVGIDWTHPDFRASAMLMDGSGYGIVENRRGDFREEDRLILSGAAYYEVAPDGMPVLTSGLAGVFPRGIPIGRISGVAEAEGRWRKSYWLRPMVHPAAVTAVLVEVGEGIQDLSPVWPAESILTQDESLFRESAASDSLAALSDTVLLLRARLLEAAGAAAVDVVPTVRDSVPDAGP